jgi:cold shock CspA family protein
MAIENQAANTNAGWYIQKNGKEFGPMNLEALLKYIGEGLIRETDFARGPGVDEWTPVKDVRELLALKPSTESGPVTKSVSVSFTPPELSRTRFGRDVPPIEERSSLKAAWPNASGVGNDADGRQHPAVQPQDLSKSGPMLVPVEEGDRRASAGSEGTRGRIKFLDPKTRKWGYIILESGGGDVHYNVREIKGEYKEIYLDGAEVSFSLEMDSKGRPEAKRIVILKYPDAPSRSIREPITRTEEDYSHKNKLFWEWASIPSSRPHEYDDERYANVLHALKEVALPEKWHLGEDEDDRRYPLLKRYLDYTFERVKNEDPAKIFYKEQDGRKWAVFNTGLVDKVYDPIYMLFNDNPTGKRPWRLFNICIEGKRSAGKRLAEIFNPCPPAAKYLESATDLIIEPGAEILIDDEHIIEDAIERDRYPPEFLRRYAPKDLEWNDYSRYRANDKRVFLSGYRKLLDQDLVRYREIKNRIQDAIELAKKRTFWNYKTAIPSYYPKRNQLDLLLPLCLDDRSDSIVTVALVVSRNRSGSYQGRTVYPLDWAYERARVVCRPDSDWLTPESIVPRGVVDDSEGFRTED